MEASMDVVLIGLFLLLCLVIVVLVFTLPVAVAHRRNHPQLDAIRACQWIGLILPIAWFVGLVWAYAGGSEPTRVSRRRRTASRRRRK